MSDLVHMGGVLWRTGSRDPAGQRPRRQYVFRTRDTEHGGQRFVELVPVGVIEADYDYDPVRSDLPAPEISWFWDVRDDALADHAVLALRETVSS